MQPFGGDQQKLYIVAKLLQDNPYKLYRYHDIKALFPESSRTVVELILNTLAAQEEVTKIRRLATLPDYKGEPRTTQWLFFYHAKGVQVSFETMIKEYAKRLNFKEPVKGIECPKCSYSSWITLETRPEVSSVRRRKQCVNCSHRITTYESIFDDADFNPPLGMMAKLERLQRYVAIMAKLLDLKDYSDS